LVSTDWLEANLDKVVPVDGSWVMPFSRRDMRDEWLQNHIKHARYLEIESISMRHPILPHLLPSAEDFGKAMDTLGINKDSHVVVYDNSYLFSACRVYWMFKVFGHKNVSVLDGGLAKWVAEKRPTFSGMDDLSRLPKVANFELFNQQDLGKNIDESSLEYVLDARAPDRFTGKIPEPRPGVPSGQIPYSINTHFEDLVNRNPDSNAITLKPREELRAYFEQQGVDIQKPLITSCGSGVTAAVIYLALREIGAPRVSLYDGSWLDYASRVESPMWRDYDDFAFDAPTTPLTENDLRARFDARKAYLRRKQAEALGRNSDTQQPPSHKYRS
ncbi:Rhodanese-like domain-containing protein, partial [Dimargaris cristalligena]